MATQSVYLTIEENVAAAALAAEHGTSVNYILRTGLRVLAGLPVPKAFLPSTGDATGD